MKILSILFLVLFCINAQAAKFKGYGQSFTEEVLTLTEKIERIEESSGDFFIALSNHAAFYRFPKTAEHALHVRDFLKRRSKEKKPVVFQIDPITTQILNMQDP